MTQIQKSVAQVNRGPHTNIAGRVAICLDSHIRCGTYRKCKLPLGRDVPNARGCGGHARSRGLSGRCDCSRGLSCRGLGGRSGSRSCSRSGSRSGSRSRSRSGRRGLGCRSLESTRNCSRSLLDLGRIGRLGRGIAVSIDLNTGFRVSIDNSTKYKVCHIDYTNTSNCVGGSKINLNKLSSPIICSRCPATTTCSCAID